MKHLTCSYRSLRDWLVSRLSRVTSSGEFIPEIDGLRFIAITTVIFHHLMASYLTNTQRLGPVKLPNDWYRLYDRSLLVHLISHWYFGVYLFFIISGFILVLPFARKYLGSVPAPSLKAYYLRRLTRLEPPYALNLTLCFIFIWMTKAGREAFVPHWFASLFYMHGLVYGGASWINGVTWSLEVEVQFYLLVPLLTTVFKIRNTVLRRALLIASILVFAIGSQLFITSSDGRLYVSLLNYAHYFLAGFLLADLFLAGWLTGAGRNYWWDGMALAAGSMILVIFAMIPRAKVIVPLVMLLFYWGIFRGVIAHRLITLRPIVIVGGLCYTIYLYHFSIIDFMSPLILQFASAGRPLWLDFGIYSVIELPLILTLCAVLFYYTEKPFMKKSPGIRLLRALGRVSSPEAPA